MMIEEDWLDDFYETPNDGDDLRLEAMELFDRCLANGSPDTLLAFIEAQIIQNPPRLDVLRDLAEDLHQRLLGLREDHFGVRERVLRAMRDDFRVDLSPLTPANALATYHCLDPEAVIRFLRRHNPRLTRQEERLARRLLEPSLTTAAQIHSDVQMTEALFACVMDWMDGLNTVIARHLWDIDQADITYSGLIH